MVLTITDVRNPGLAEVVVAAGSVVAISVDLRLMVAMPLAMLLVYRTYNHRLHLRAERYTWERLAAVTDALTDQDPTVVLHTAARGALDLFGAHVVDVEVQEPGRSRLVRATSGPDTTYDGPPVPPPSANPAAAAHPWGDRDGTGIHGVLRLYLRGSRDSLTDREWRTLKVFGSALSTSVDNAIAYAQLAAAVERYEHQATHDPLTGLANRRHLLERLAQELGRHDTTAPDGSAAALLLFDLNHFKDINDTLGHAAGDELLSTVAQRLDQATASHGYLAARLGGDEFAVVMTDGRANSYRARQIHAAICRPVKLRAHQFGVYASAGLACAADGIDAEELLRRADVAMYQGKREAMATTVVWDGARDTADPRRLSLAAAFPDALINGQIEIDFQPVVELATGRAIAVQAIPRWRHPQEGLLPEAHWRDLVEQCGALTQYTAFVLRGALAGAQAWIKAGFDLPIAVHVRPKHLVAASTTGLIFSQLLQHGLPPNKLILELTDAGPIDPHPRLSELHRVGVHLTIGNWGVSGSSLSMLTSSIPFGGVRIDRSFVADLQSREASLVVSAAVTLGGDLDIVVSADGIDTDERRQKLTDLGCEAGRGDLIGAPMSSAALITALTAGSDGRKGHLLSPLRSTVITLRGRDLAG